MTHLMWGLLGHTAQTSLQYTCTTREHTKPNKKNECMYAHACTTPVPHPALPQPHPCSTTTLPLPPPCRPPPPPLHHPCPTPAPLPHHPSCTPTWTNASGSSSAPLSSACPDTAVSWRYDTSPPRPLLPTPPALPLLLPQPTSLLLLPASSLLLPLSLAFPAYFGAVPRPFPPGWGPGG